MYVFVCICLEVPLRFREKLLPGIETCDERAYHSTVHMSETCYTFSTNDTSMKSLYFYLPKDTNVTNVNVELRKLSILIIFSTFVSVTKISRLQKECHPEVSWLLVP